jgi:hypothetical protein
MVVGMHKNGTHVPQRVILKASLFTKPPPIDHAVL